MEPVPILVPEIERLAFRVRAIATNETERFYLVLPKTHLAIPASPEGEARLAGVGLRIQQPETWTW